MSSSSLSSPRISISVSVRGKPLSSEEVSETSSNVHTKIRWDKPEGSVEFWNAENNPSSARVISGFSNILLDHDDQSTTFERTCAPLINGFVEHGYNSTFFVYGQTGSGKTHTLFGPPNSFNPHSLSEANERFASFDIPSTWGVFPRAVLMLLNSKPGISLTATAVEIYMENCYDLLHNKVRVPIAGYGKSIKNTTTRESLMQRTARDSSGKWISPLKNGAVNTQCVRSSSYETSGAKTKRLGSIGDLVSFMSIIDVNRSSKSHKLNDRSSRSHCAITIVINGTSSATTNPKGKLMMVDLAGSERIKKSGATRLVANEAMNINKSLSALGRCISALGEGARFIPYRDSVLTMLLKQSLSGDCVTSVVVTVARNHSMISETIASLHFGARCTKVATTKVAVPVVAKGIRLAELYDELKSLDRKLAQMESSGVGGGLNLEFPAPTRMAFQDNSEKLNKHISKVHAIKGKISAFESSHCTDANKLEFLTSSLKYEESQVRNLKGILVRSMTTGIWIEPKQSYCRNLEQRRNIVAEIQSLVDETEVIPCDEKRYPLKFKDLLVGFEG